MPRFMAVTALLALTFEIASAQTTYYVDGACGDDGPKRILR